ncbi:MAG: Na+/H+ antiporter NhaA [Microbacterium sp.]
MTSLRSARLPAVLLLAAAVCGLALANSPFSVAVLAAIDHPLPAPAGFSGLAGLSVRRVVSEGLLAVFFFVAAIELRQELSSGQLSSPKRAVLPAIAAGGGVLAPIAVYLVIAGGSSAASGWPIPTATDIAFSLGVLAVFGRGLPPAVRVFLLALAILDDIVGIFFIAVLSATDLDAGMILLAAGGVAVFAVGSRLLTSRPHGWMIPCLVVCAAATWLATYRSGVHATLAGVALGLAMAPRPARRVRHGLEPWVNGVVLPLFALTAALVVVPSVPLRDLSPALWGVLVALPLGKLVGITAAGGIAQRALGLPAESRLALGDLIAVGALGGIGFTVSLLLAELSFRGASGMRDQAVLGVLTGSAVSLVLAAVLVSWRAWHHRRRAATTPSAPM